MKRNESVLFVPIFCLLFCQALFAQKPVTFGAYTPEELAMTSYPLDPTADAVVLLDVIKVEPFENMSVERATANRNSGNPQPYYGYTASRHIKIKLLKASAFNRANISISYTREANDVSLYNLYAHTISPKGYAKEVGEKDFKSERVSGTYYKKKFTFPAVEEGCIIEYYFETKSSNLFELPTYYLQRDIPVANTTLYFNPQGSLEYTYLFKGLLQFDSIQNEGTLFKKGEASFMKSDYFFTAKNLPAVDEEPYLHCIEEYRLGVTFVLSAIRTPNELERFDSWEGLGKQLKKGGYFGEQITRKGNYSKILDKLKPILDPLTSDSARIEAAYLWLSRNMKWDGEYSYGTNEDLNDLFVEKSANSGALNLMLLAICHAYEIKNIYPAITKPLSEGAFLTDFPYHANLGHVMVYYEGGAVPRWYDVHDPFLESGKPHANALNSKAWIINGEKTPRFETIKPTKGTDAISFDLFIENETTLKGTLKGSYSGYNALPERRAHYKDSTAQHWVERLKERYLSVKIDSASCQNLHELNQSFKEKATISLPDAVTINGDMLYVSPIIHSGYIKSPFEKAERRYPIEYSYPSRESIVCSIHIPDGYELVELPKTINMALSKNNEMTYSITCQMGENNTLQVTQKIDINTLYYDAINYQAVKDFFDRVAEAMAVQVVFRKK